MIGSSERLGIYIRQNLVNVRKNFTTDEEYNAFINYCMNGKIPNVGVKRGPRWNSLNETFPAGQEKDLFSFVLADFRKKASGQAPVSQAVLLQRRQAAWGDLVIPTENVEDPDNVTAEDLAEVGS